MSGFFMYHRRSRPTGQVIARALGLDHGEDLLSRRNSWQPLDYLIRWGHRGSSGGNRPERTVNEPASLSNASDKLRSLDILRDAGIRVPDWSTDPTDLEFPFLGRRIQHARGTDVVLCLQKGDYERRPRDYYVKYIPTTREFRVHVVNGEVIRIQGKFLDIPNQAVPWIRNYATGYRFRAPRRRLRQTRLDAAIASVQALGLDFGAVDLLVGNDNLEYVLEVNTAPSCSPLTARAYVDAFAGMLDIPSVQLRLDVLNELGTDQDDVGEDTVEEEEPTYA